MCGCRCIILYYKQRLQRYDPIIVINVTLAHANRVILATLNKSQSNSVCNATTDE